MEFSCLCGHMPTMATAAVQLTSLRLYSFGRQPRSSPHRLQSTSSSRDSGSISSDPPKETLPWTIMGRTVRIQDDHESASDQSQSLESGIEELLGLLPDLAEQLKSNKQLSLRLSKDFPGIAMKLVKLRAIFPNSNVLEMVGKRLSMLLDEEFSLIEGNLQKLQATLPDADVVSLIEQQPLFLFEDTEVILAELRSLKQPGKSMQETVALVGKDAKLAGLLVLRLDVRQAVYQGVPRQRYP